MREDATRPVGVQSAFWELPEVTAALRARDLGRLFRLLAVHADASQTRIGIAVGLSQGQVSQVMNGARQLSAIEVLERVANGLDMPDAARMLVGLAPRLRPAAALDVDEMDEPDAWALADAITRSSIGAQVMSRFERLTEAQAARYPSTPPSQMWPAVRRELARAEQALAQRQSLSIQRRLVVVVGRLAGLAGNLAIDLGRRTKAAEYFDLGRLAGEEADDSDLSAWALTLQSLDPFFGGNVQEAAVLLDRASQLSAHASGARRRAWIEALRARAHAAGGDHAAAVEALSAAYSVIYDADPPTGTDFFDQHRLDGIAGSTYLLLRDTARAVELIARAVERRPYTDAKGRALLTLDQAACSVVDQAPDDAVALVHHALDLAEGQLVRPIVVRVRQVHADMTRWRGTESVKTLDERLAAIDRDGIEGT